MIGRDVPQCLPDRIVFMNISSVRSWVKAAASAAAQVGVTDPGSNYLLIDNGIIAVRVAKAISVFSDAHLGTTPSNAFIDHTGPLPNIPIPIQGVRHVDGTWTATDGRKFLTSYYQTVAEGQIWQALPATAMTTTIVENGPLRAVVEVLYTGPRVARIYNSITYDGIEDAYYKCTITLEAGQPCFIVKDDTNWGILKYNFNMNVGVNADVYRYRGHHASDPIYGHLADGTTVYPAAHSRNPDYDAEALLSTDPLHVWYNGYPIGYPPLYNWYTWGANGGYYYHCANAAVDGTGLVFGIFQGPASVIEGNSSSIGLYSEPGDSEHGVDIYYGQSVDQTDNTLHQTHIVEDGSYIGTKADDFPADFMMQPPLRS